MTSRSGRVTVKSGDEKTVVAAGLTGGNPAMYRFFNSGKGGQKVEIRESGAKLADLEWKDSVDVAVTNKAISVKAVGATADPPAEVVYDFLGLA